MEKLISKAMDLTPEQIVEAVTLIGGDFEVSREVRLARAALLTAYEQKVGGEAVDALMDALGM